MLRVEYVDFHCGARSTQLNSFYISSTSRESHQFRFQNLQYQLSPDQLVRTLKFASSLSVSQHSVAEI